MCDKIIRLSKSPFSPNCVRSEPLIQRGHNRFNEEVGPRREENGNRVEVLIWGLWEHQTYAINDFIFVDTDCVAFNKGPMSSLLAWWKKNDKHGKHFHDKRKQFHPLVLSVDGMLGNESYVVLNQFSWLMEEKLEESVSHVCRWIHGKIVIAVAQFYSLMIHGACLHSPL